MKKTYLLLLVAALIISASSCSSETKTVQEPTAASSVSSTTTKELALVSSDSSTTAQETSPETGPTTTIPSETAASTVLSSDEAESDSTTAITSATTTETANTTTTSATTVASTTKAPETTVTTTARSKESEATAEATTTSATTSTISETTTAVTEKPGYDNSSEYPATVLKEGDSITGGTYSATGKDESVLEASGNVKASVTGAILKKISGDASSADDSSFKGLNAGVRVYGSADVTLTDCVIEADAKNATGVFAYDNGVIHISDSTVNVTGGGAGGVQVAGGGTLYGNNLTVTSASKAAIRSDRGGGIMVIDGGIYTSEGSSGCPVIYSTADITVKNAVGVSEQSRAVIIEGKNSVMLENCTLTGNDQSTKSGSIRANVLLYQSASGDANEGISVFSMTGGKMISQSGAMFYCTNTSSVVNLRSAELVLSDTGDLLIVSAGRWGKDGKNGGKCVFNAEDQTLEGNITVDSISSLELNLKNSTYKGAIANEGKVTVTLGSGSKWELTGDSYITAFNGDVSNIISNGYKLYVNGKALSISAQAVYPRCRLWCLFPSQVYPCQDQ